MPQNTHCSEIKRQFLITKRLHQNNQNIHAATKVSIFFQMRWFCAFHDRLFKHETVTVLLDQFYHDAHDTLYMRYRSGWGSPCWNVAAFPQYGLCDSILYSILVRTAMKDTQFCELIFFKTKMNVQMCNYTHQKSNGNNIYNRQLKNNNNNALVLHRIWNIHPKCVFGP